MMRITSYYTGVCKLIAHPPLPSDSGGRQRARPLPGGWGLGQHDPTHLRCGEGGALLETHLSVLIDCIS